MQPLIDRTRAWDGRHRLRALKIATLVFILVGDGFELQRFLPC